MCRQIGPSPPWGEARKRVSARLLRTPLLLPWLAAACGGSEAVGPDLPSEISLVPSHALVTQVGDTVRFSARVLGASGQSLPTAATWSSTDLSVGDVDPSGLFTAAGPGSVGIVASAGAATATASLEVWLPPAVDRYLPGERYLGRRGYVEYVPGTLPLILAAPHGGDRTPDDEIPDRTGGTTVTDTNTLPLAEEMAEALEALTGERPHLIISHLRRTKLDPNREIGEAAEGNVFAEHAWREYHDFIGRARESVTASAGAGLFLDIHGHGHPIPRVELGYLLSAAALALPDEALDTLVRSSSVRHLVEAGTTTLSTIVRGPASLGSLMEAAGIPAVPSGADPHPGFDPYFSGGYSTRVHGSRDGGSVSAIQLEHHRPGLRDTAANRRAYASALAPVLMNFMAHHLPAGGTLSSEAQVRDFQVSAVHPPHLCP